MSLTPSSTLCLPGVNKSCLNEKDFQKKLRKVKKSQDYPLMIALADIIIDSFIASRKQQPTSR